MELGSTLIQAATYFQDYDNCHKFMVNLRWPDGIIRCPRCHSDHVKYLEKPRVWKCYSKHESPKFSLKTGTVFEDSPIPLAKWLPAVWMVVNDKNRISSWELHRALGVTQKTAWFMLHRIRLAMQDEKGGKLSGNIEVDESMIGGKSRNMHRASGQRKITALAVPTRKSCSAWSSVTGVSARCISIAVDAMNSRRRFAKT